jgi:lipoate-protein ligase A
MRRWTGGGTVFHGEELTLGLWIPASGSFTCLSSAQIYQMIHERLLPAVRQILPVARLVALEDCRCGPVCFESPVAYDIIAGSRKILGGALRRSLQSVLYQGSLHASIAPISVAEALADEVLPLENLPDLENSAASLVRQRYGDPAWLNLR